MQPQTQQPELTIEGAWNQYREYFTDLIKEINLESNREEQKPQA